MKTSRLDIGDWLAGAGGLLLLVALFVPWFGRDDPYCVEIVGVDCPQGASFDAWQAFSLVDVILLLAAAAGIAMAVIAVANAKTDLPITSAAMTVPLGLLATFLVAYRVIDPVGDLSRKAGLWLGLIGAASITYGSWRSIRDERSAAVL